jgi:hypothetical protein
MFDKAKPTKLELKKLAKGLEAAGALGQQLAALDQAIEAHSKVIAFVDGEARQALSRAQLSLGVSNAYLQRLVVAGKSYLAGQQQKSAPKAKAKAKGQTKAAAKAKGKAKGKAKSGR